jgi:U3 small nucleolar ribonucleoprotein protein LCP5
MSQTHDDSDASEDESDDDSKAKDKRKSKSEEGGVYVPPKLTAVHYEDESKAERARKQLERAKKRALGSSIIQDLKDEYLDTPKEITGTNRAQQMLSREQQEKTEYEEAYLTRLPITKEEKRRQRRLTTLGMWFLGGKD